MAILDRGVNKSGLNPAQWLINTRWKVRAQAARNPFLASVVNRAGRTQDMDTKEALTLARASEVMHNLRQRLDSYGVDKLDPEEKEILSYWLTEGRRIDSDPDWDIVQAMDPSEALRFAHPASLVDPSNQRHQKLSELADSLNRDMQDARFEMNRLGQLGQDTFMRFIDGYLRRDYDWAKSKYHRYQGGGTHTRFASIGKTPIRPITGTMKRGQSTTLSKAEWDDYQYKQANWRPMGVNTDANGNRTYEFLDHSTGNTVSVPETEAFNITSSKRLINTNPDGSVTVHDDMGLWERLTKGQTFQRLEETLGEFMNSATRDIARGRFMEALANDTRYSSTSIVVSGKTVTKGVAGRPYVDDSGKTWFFVPTTKANSGSGGKSYGALSGKFISEELHDGLVTEARVQEVNDFLNKAGTWTLAKATKVGATLFNPVYYGVNFLANTAAFLAYGGNVASLLPFTLNRVTLQRAKALAVVDNRTTFEDLALHESVWSSSKLNYTIEKLSRLAQVADDYFRARLFQDLLAQGYSEDDAVLVVRKAFYNPHMQDSILLNAAENTIQPFTKVVNYLAWFPMEAVAERPVSALLAFSALGGAYSAIEAQSYDRANVDEDKDNALRAPFFRNLNLPEYALPLKALFQRSLRVGGYDMDLSSINPWARLAPVELQDPGGKPRPVASRVTDYITKQLLRPGTPVVNWAIAVGMGLDPVSGKKVYDAAHDDRFKAFVESSLPVLRIASRAVDYARGTPNLRDVRDGAAAVFSPLVGIKLHTRDTDRETAQAIRGWNVEYQDFLQRINTIKREAVEYESAGNSEAANRKLEELSVVVDGLEEFVKDSEPFIERISK